MSFSYNLCTFNVIKSVSNNTHIMFVGRTARTADVVYRDVFS